MSDRDDDDLAAVAADLEAAMRDLQGDLESDLPRGPLGLPRPPSPGEVLRFADEAVIPAAIAVLEANIKILEAIQRAIRLADAERTVRSNAEASTERAATITRETLTRFDKALSDLEEAIETGGMPDNDLAREILTEARELRSDLEAEIAAAKNSDTPSPEEDNTAATADEDGDTEDGDDQGETGDRGVDIDIDSELESIKQDYEDTEDQDDSSDRKQDA